MTGTSLTVGEIQSTSHFPQTVLSGSRSRAHRTIMSFAEIRLDGGHITKAEYIYLFKEDATNTLGHVGAMCILWCLAFRCV